jgi:transaldolase
VSILIDSANIDDVRKAVALGWVSGVTTNPSILAKVKGRPEEIIDSICRISPGPVFYQVTADTLAEREQEGRKFHDICRDKVVLKIPATTENMTLVARLSEEIPCAVTAVYAASQAIVACEAGARYVIPYVNRATRLLGDGLTLVTELAKVAAGSGLPTEIVAASIKSAAEAAATVAAGAHHLTMPLDVILMLGDHPLSDQAVAEFDAAWRGRETSPG